MCTFKVSLTVNLEQFFLSDKIHTANARLKAKNKFQAETVKKTINYIDNYPLLQ